MKKLKNKWAELTSTVPNKFSMLWMVLVILSFTMLNYRPGWGEWVALAGSVLIVFFGRLAWRKDFLWVLGLKLNKKEILFSIISALVLLVCSYQLILAIGKANGVEVGGLSVSIHHVFYTLNEEIVLGALFLGLMKRVYNGFHPAVISVMVAVFFALLHYGVYRWVFIKGARGILSIYTILALFAIGVVRNNLILNTRHIGYAWALHLGWIGAMLGSGYMIFENSRRLTELERLNIFIGSPWTLGITMTLMFLSFLLFLKKRKKDR